MNGILHEEPGRSVFEGQVLRIDHEWGDDYDVQAGGWDGEPPIPGFRSTCSGDSRGSGCA